MNIDYASYHSKDEFEYYYVLNPKNRHSNDVYEAYIKPALQRAQEDYSIEIKELSWGETPSEGNNIYVLYGPTNPLMVRGEEADYIKTLSAIEGSRINMIGAYPLVGGEDTEFYTEFSKTVPQEGKYLGVNIMFTDNLDTSLGLRTIDSQDLLDNIICETIRVKYVPRVSEDGTHLGHLESYRQKYSSDIDALANLYREYNLWHRDVTDGAVLIRDRDIEGYFVSQTKTNKTEMSKTSFSLVDSYDDSSRSLVYVGEKLPSSDSPELMGLSERVEQSGKFSTYYIHFHRTDVTRGEEHRDHVTSAKIEYGLWQSGEEIFKELEGKESHWLILKEHGILWLGDSLDDFEKFLSDTLKLTKDSN